jgi:hypothetical protein
MIAHNQLIPFSGVDWGGVVVRDVEVNWRRDLGLPERRTATVGRLLPSSAGRCIAVVIHNAGHENTALLYR